MSVIQTLPLYEIDDKIVEKLESENVPEKARVVNLYRSIIVHVQTAARREPYLLSISDAAEEVIRRFQGRQIESREALEQLAEMAKKIAASEAERNQYKLTKEEFSIFWILREKKVSNDIVGLSREMLKFLDSNKTWPLNKKKEMEVRRGIYKLLLKRTDSTDLAGIVNSILDIHRRLIKV